MIKGLTVLISVIALLGRDVIVGVSRATEAVLGCESVGAFGTLSFRVVVN